MGIEKLGESLLSNVRERNDRLASESRRRDRKQAIAILGTKALVGIGNAYLRDKAVQFAQNQDILGSKALFKDATNAAQTVLDEHTAMMKSEKGKVNPVEYEKDLLRDTFTAQFKMNADPNEVGTNAYQQLIESELTKLAETRVNKRNEILEAAKKLKSQETFDLEAANAIRSARGLTVGDSITNSILGLFSGTSAADREQLAIKAIQANDPNRKRVLTLMEEYNKTKNLVTAYDFANVVVPKTPKEERFEDVSTYQIKSAGSNLYIIKQKVLRDKFGILEDKQQQPTIELADKNQANDIALKSMKSNFNFATQAKTILNTEHLEDFVREVGKEGIQLTNIKNVTEYGKVSEIFQDVMERSGALQDKYNDDLSKTMLNGLVSTNAEIILNLASEDNESAFDLLEELADLAQQYRNRQR
jgi:hypothetical protein